MLMQDEYEKQRRIQENQGCRQRMVRKVSRLRLQKPQKTRNPGKSVQKSSPGGARNTRHKMKRKKSQEILRKFLGNLEEEEEEEGRRKEDQKRNSTSMRLLW